jgi:uncharacterized protein
MKVKQIVLLLLALALTSWSIAAQTKQELNDQLFEAVRAGDAARVTTLLDKGAEVNAKFRYGTTALFKAAERGHLEVAKILLERGVDVTVKDTFYGSTALSWALQNDHIDVVKAILIKDTGSVDEVLLTGVRAGTLPLVEIALAQGGSKPETLTTALAAAMNDKDKAAIAEMLKKAGAVPPLEVDAATLQTYVGSFKSEQGTVVSLSTKDGKLTAQVVGQPALALSAIDKTSFRPVDFDGMVFTMTVESGRVDSFTLKRGPTNTVYKRIAETKP